MLMPSHDRPNLQALAAIRPGDSKAKLVAAVGPRWRDPLPHEVGEVTYLEEDFRFSAQLDRDGNVGKVRFHYNFAPDAAVEGVRMLMPEAEVIKAAPQLTFTAQMEGFPYRHGNLTLDSGARFGVEIGHGKVNSMSIVNPEAVYADRPQLPLPRPASTFDIIIVPGLRPRGTPAPDGWCCGLPRGIAPIQWPLSHRTGFPLEHHFTIRVPAPYRTQGPDYVALAFFSETGNESAESEAVHDLMEIVFDGRPLPDSVAPELQPFLDHLRQRHPMEFRSKDILYQTFAALWLTEQEFQGEECEPPALIQTPANAQCSPPDWHTVSATQRLFGWDGEEEFNERYGLHRLAGHKPSNPWELLLFKQTERHDDPNTGCRPDDNYVPSDNEDGYVPKYSDEWEALNIEIAYGPLHFGGTANPCQGMPALSPFYLEFNETPGMLNFGGGNGQLDLISMRIDWAQ
jgi:hypothetical protein